MAIRRDLQDLILTLKSVGGLFGGPPGSPLAWGYEIVPTRQWANWCASINATRADLPLISRSTLRTLAPDKESAVAEAKQKIDRVLAS
jgi:hypothetical protein